MFEDWSLTITEAGKIIISNDMEYKISYNLIQNKKELDYNKYKVICPNHNFETFKSLNLVNCFMYVEAQESNIY